MRNDFETHDNVTVIFVHRKGKIHEVLIDTEDLPVAQSVPGHWYLIWHVRGHELYAAATLNEKQVLLHRLIMGAGKHDEVDHLKHNTLDNRRSELRLVSHLENQHNRQGPNRNGASGFLGVTMSRSGRWIGKFTFLGQRIHVGVFATKHEAAGAVAKKRSELLEA